MVDTRVDKEEETSDNEFRFDFFAPSFQENPKESYAKMHESCPFSKGAKGGYHVVSRYADVVSMCKNPELWSSKWGPGLRYYSPDEARALVNVDPPQHDIEVQIVQKAFAGRFIQAMEGGIRKFCKEQIDSFIDKGSCDIHQDYSVPLPLYVICELLGLEYADAEKEGFRDWVVTGTSATIIDADDEEKMAIAMDGHQKMVDYFIPKLKDWADKVARGEAEPDENLITRLVTAEHEGNKLAENKILGFCCFLLGAGSTTTTTVLSNLIYRLTQEPEQFAKLRENPDLAGAAVEESLRYDAPVHGLFRTNNTPTDLGPHHLETDSKVALLWGAANMDPEFWDQPDKFNIEREMKDMRRNLSFGFGIHTCLGASLARLELRVAMEELMKRIPDFHLDGETVLAPPDVLSGFDKLPIAWD